MYATLRRGVDSSVVMVSSAGECEGPMMSISLREASDTEIPSSNKSQS
jgi:hypothetical protein